MPTETEIKFAEADAYTSELMKQVRAAPVQGTGPLAMQRRTFFKLAGAASAGLVLGFHLPNEAFAAEMATTDVAHDQKDQVMNAFIRIAPDNNITIYSK